MDTNFEVLTDTIMHISEVQENIEDIIHDLKKRGVAHDRSKLTAIEFDTFVKTRPEFKKVNYGTAEYQAVAEKAKVAVENHYSSNRHHTAYHKNGINDMNLLDILEMLADWKAASRRSPDLTFLGSLPRAFQKYSIPKNMQRHIMLTLEYLGWAKKNVTL